MTEAVPSSVTEPVGLIVPDLVPTTAQALTAVAQLVEAARLAVVSVLPLPPLLLAKALLLTATTPSASRPATAEWIRLCWICMENSWWWMGKHKTGKR